MLLFFLTLLLAGITVLHIQGLYVQAVPYKAVKLNHTPQYRFYIIQEEKIVIRVCRTTLLPFFQLTTVAVAVAVT